MNWERDYDPARPALLVTLGFIWDEVLVRWGPLDGAEVWVHPDDWAEIGSPPDYMGAPFRTSPGVARGSARIFDRATLRYLPPPDG